MDCIQVYTDETIRMGCAYKAWVNLGADCKKVIPKPDKPKKRKSKAIYKALCWKLTEENALNVPDCEKRNFKLFHLDHIVSIHEGFKRGIPVELIASTDNLRIIPANDNLTKGTALTNESLRLLKLWGY